VQAGALPLLQAVARAQQPRWPPFARLAGALVDVLVEANLRGGGGEEDVMVTLSIVAPVQALLLSAASALGEARLAGGGQLVREDAAAEVRIGELLSRLSG
jgi:hypothetical protein